MEEDLKIGRITRNVEKALGLSLTSSVLVYADESFLDKLTRDHPERYLKIMEEVSSLLKKPDFVSFNEKKEEFVYLRVYCKEGNFKIGKLTISHVGKPKEWKVGSFGLSYLGEIKKGADIKLVRVL